MHLQSTDTVTAEKDQEDKRSRVYMHDVCNISKQQLYGVRMAQKWTDFTN